VCQTNNRFSSCSIHFWFLHLNGKQGVQLNLHERHVVIPAFSPKKATFVRSCISTTYSEERRHTFVNIITVR
jgi:hypothetical protein